MRTFILVALLLLCTQVTSSAQAGTWKLLSKITWKKEYDEMMGYKVDVPVFSKELKAIEGQEVSVKGYIIPIEGYSSQTEFILSAFPYSMCFFCGGAGPETVMEVTTKKSFKYTADMIEVKGILRLNDSDISSMMYLLEDAELVD